jgi:hypothetical protein
MRGTLQFENCCSTLPSNSTRHVLLAEYNASKISYPLRIHPAIFFETLANFQHWMRLFPKRKKLYT